MNIKYNMLLYLIFVFLIYLWKPDIFIINDDTNKRKLIYLLLLLMTIAVFTFYIKIGYIMYIY